MICQKCQQNAAKVRVVDLPEDWELGAEGKSGAQQLALCEFCAQAAGIPSMKPKPSISAIFKLLQISGQQPKARVPSCKGCGMNLLEFRQRGRLGCPRCYDVFQEYLSDLLERVHGATRHVGRVPGLDDEQLERLQRCTELERELETAIREEAYEQAARLRDELNALREA